MTLSSIGKKRLLSFTCLYKLLLMTLHLDLASCIVGLASLSLYSSVFRYNELSAINLEQQLIPPSLNEQLALLRQFIQQRLNTSCPPRSPVPGHQQRRRR